MRAAPVSATPGLTTAQALVAFLAAQEVKRDGASWPFFAGIYGIFGHGNVAGLGEALEAMPTFRYRQARNEQAMVHAATACARQRRRLRAFACTSSLGPGATNMLTGAATATVNCIPVLLLPGDLFAGRRVAPVLQQLEQPDTQDISVNDCFKPVSRSDLDPLAWAGGAGRSRRVPVHEPRVRRVHHEVPRPGQARP